MTCYTQGGLLGDFKFDRARGLWVAVQRVTETLASQGCQEHVTEKGQTLFLKMPNFGFC